MVFLLKIMAIIKEVIFLEIQFEESKKQMLKELLSLW